MTGLRRWQRIARCLIIFSLTWEAAVTIVSLVVLILVAVQGGPAASSDRLLSVAGTFGVSGVVIWAIWDARRRGRRQRLQWVATAEKEV